MGRESSASQELRAVSVDELLVEGLGHYGNGDVEEASRCWRLVLALEPENADALDHIESSGASPMEDADAIAEPAYEREVAPRAKSLNPSALRTLVVELLAERRYDELLDVLLEAHRTAPGDPGVSRGIRLVKERLIIGYSKTIGDLDRIPRTRVPEQYTPTPEESLVLRSVDGIVSFSDVLDASALGRFQTYRKLANLVEAGVLNSDDPPDCHLSATRVVAAEGPPSTRTAAAERAFAQWLGTDGGVLQNTPQAPPAAEPCPEPIGSTWSSVPPPVSAATDLFLEGNREKAIAILEARIRKRPEDELALHNLEMLKGKQD